MPLGLLFLPKVHVVLLRPELNVAKRKRSLKTATSPAPEGQAPPP